MTETKGVYSPRQAAAQLGVSERTIRRWIGEGRLAARRYGRQLRISAGALDDVGEPADVSADSWAEMSTDAFGKDWDNDLDAEYDDWRRLYGVPPG